MVRILVTSTPGTGHIHPLVPLARELSLAGHEVIWATGADACARVEEYGFRTVPAGLTRAERLQEVEKRQGELIARTPQEARVAALRIMFGEIAAPAMRDDLRTIMSQLQPDVVVHDLIELAAAPVAASRGIPNVCVAFGMALNPTLLAAAAASVGVLWSDEGLTPSPTAGLYDNLYLHPLPAAIDEPPPEAAVRGIRPMHFDGAGTDAPPPWLESFGVDRPGIYVTFGTEFGGRAPWPQIVDAVGSIDGDAVLTVGGDIDETLLGPLPGNLRVETYLPQRFVLERASVVISHAGSGTLFAAAARGLPQVCIPMGADQWDNAGAVAGADVATVLGSDDRDTESIRTAVVEVLRQERYAPRPRPSQQGSQASPTRASSSRRSWGCADRERDQASGSQGRGARHMWQIGCSASDSVD